jgi:Ca2+-binding RTX toxin-like protein
LRPLRLEILEDRALLASYYPNFAADVAANLSGPQGVQESLNNFFDGSAAVLPVFGSLGTLDQFAASQFIDDAANELAGLGSYSNITELETQLQVLFPAATVVQKPMTIGIDVFIPLHGEPVEETTTLMPLDIGLPGVPVDLSAGPEAGIEVTVGYDYQLAFRYAGNPQSFWLQDPNGSAPELEISLGVELADGFEANATVGFLQAEVSDNTPEDPELSITLTVNGLDATPTLDMTGSANLDLGIDTGVTVYSEKFPSVKTDFVLDWTFPSSSSPTVELKDISLNLGDVITSAFQPLVEFVQPILEPIQPVIDFGNEPIPVLSDLSHLVGGPDVTLFDLMDLGGAALPEAYEELVDLGLLMTDIVDLIGDLTTTDEGLALNLGDYSLNDLANNVDLRTLVPHADAKNLNEAILQPGFNFSSLNGEFDLEAIKAMVDDLNVPDELEPFKTGVKNLLDKLGDPGFEYSFPVVDDPLFAAVSLVMGNDFKLFEFTGSASTENADAPTGDFDLPIGISVGLGGYITFDASVDAGFDTYGVRTFLNSGNPTDILDGFYLEDTTHFEMTGTIAAYAGVNWANVFEAGVSGGVYASFGMDNANLDIDGDHRVRRTEHPILFEVSGGLHAFLNAYVEVGVEVLGEFIGYREEFNLINETLGSFTTEDVPNPFIPVAPLWLAADPSTATPSSGDPNTLTVIEPNGVLHLNVGPRGTLYRGPAADPTDTSESYFILSRTDEDSNFAIGVSAFGFTQWFYDVQRIEADAGIDVDRIEIAEEVTVPVELHGGPGNDQLKYHGSGQAVLWGDDDDDLLQSGTGDDNQLYGGNGHDTLRAGAISEGAPKYTNRLEGGDGDDELYAGQGFNNNVLYGDNGDDSLFASDYGDVLYGGDGDDFFDTGGDGGLLGDWVIGGQGDDRVTWEVGDSTAHFYGNDLTLTPHAPDRGYDAIGIKGSNGSDTFEASDLTIGEVSHFAQVMHGIGAGVILAQVEAMGIEARGGADTTTIHDLANTSIQDVGVNVGDIIDPDNAQDQVFVEGTAGADTVVVRLQDAALYSRPVVLGGITLMEVVPHYDVKIGNVEDHVELTTFAGEDLVDVHGISGPTWIDTAEDNDQLHVIANATTLPFVVGDSNFLAPLSIDAGAGANTAFFTVDGAPHVMLETIHLTNQTVTAERLLPDGIVFTATGGSFGGGIWLDTGAAHDTVYVLNTLPNVKTLVTTGAGADTIVLSSNPQGKGNLATIEGPIEVDAGSGGNYLRMDDRGANSGNALVQILSMSIHGLAGPTDNTDVLYAASGGTYAQIRVNTSDNPAVNEAVRINNPNGPLILSTHRSNETINVESTLFYVDIFAGKGDDVVNVGGVLNQPGSNSLDNIYGSVAVFGGDGIDRLNVNDEDSPNGTNYTLTTSSLHRLNAGLMMFDKKVEYLNVKMTRHGDVVSATQIPKKTAVEFEDFGADDYFFGPNKPAEFNILGTNTGVVNGTLEFLDIEHLVGGNKQDRFAFLTASGTAVFSGSISGGSGEDTLDYSGVTDDVTVNLPTAAATYTGSVLNVEHVIGGSGNDVLIGTASNNSLHGNAGDDILVGNAGKDHLFGGLGRDVLIGGDDPDRLWGDEGEDILIGGVTAHDANILALLAVMAEWSRGDLGYTDRVTNLRVGGGLNGLTVLDASTVLDDLAKDTLRGGDSLDWFFAKQSNPKKDKLPDYTAGSGEEVDWL